MHLLSSELIAGYTALFVPMPGAYAVQQMDGSYRRAREQLPLHRVIDHLQGRYTLGVYPLDGSGMCTLAVFDDDRPDGLDRLYALSVELAIQGITALLEASRRGGHLWVFFVEPTPASLVRSWLLPYAACFGIKELFPKQDQLVRDGVGSLIRLPLGIHRVSGEWYPFVARGSDGCMVPVGRTIPECCAWVIRHIQRVQVPPSIFKMPLASLEPEDTLVMSSSPVVADAIVQYDRTHSIRAWCQEQDIHAVISRSVQLDRRGVGSCPFKDHHPRGDMHPSFQVFGGQDPHWYCYAWRRAGNVFDFLCLYYGFTVQEAWDRLQQGALV